MKWEALTSFEIGRLDRKLPVILPIAAIEQHGPHLPLSTDSLIADHFMDQLHQTVPDEVLILPTVRVGCSDHHMVYSGTLTSQHLHFLKYLQDLITSVIHHGFNRIIVFNCHGGNHGIAQVLMEKVGYKHPEIRILTVTWWQLIAAGLKKIQISGPGGVGHAGEFETSLLLHFAPEVVRKQKIPQERSNQKTWKWADGDMLIGPSAGLYQRMDQKTVNGVFGDPWLGTAEKGASISNLVVQKMISIIHDLGKMEIE